jgi:hypothetical protein
MVRDLIAIVAEDEERPESESEPMEEVVGNDSYSDIDSDLTVTAEFHAEIVQVESTPGVDFHDLHHHRRIANIGLSDEQMKMLGHNHVSVDDNEYVF